MRFFSKWGQLLLARPSWSKGATSVYRLIPPVLLMSIIPSIGAFWGNVPWWIVPIATIAAFYLSFTAGMAWILSSGPSVEVGPVKLDLGEWGQAIGIFYTTLRNGRVPAKITVQIWTDAKHIEHSWEGHWRGQPSDFAGELKAMEKAQYGLVGIASSGEDAGLFIWSNEISKTGRAPVFHAGARAETKKQIRIDFVVNCETKDERADPQEHFFLLSYNPDSPAKYEIVPDQTQKLPLMLVWKRIGFLFGRGRRGPSRKRNR